MLYKVDKEKVALRAIKQDKQKRMAYLEKTLPKREARYHFEHKPYQKVQVRRTTVI